VYKAKGLWTIMKRGNRMAYSDFLVGPHELKQHPEWRVVDCRFELTRPDQGLSEYLSGHIPGAIYAHLDRDLAAPVTSGSGRHPLPEPAQFTRTLGRFGITSHTCVVVYDQGGGAIAARLWWMLRWMGHRSVRLLDGGMNAWQREGLPLCSEVPQFEPAIYTGRPAPGMVVTTREVEQALEAGSPLPLLDARDAVRFEGNAEPIDPVAGHIPAARNFPFSRSLTAEGVWRSEAELRDVWSEVLGDVNDGASGGDRGRLTAMCGSGVTACHLVLSAGLAGLELPRLYVGSWSEWIRDPAHPVAVGAASGVAERPAGRR
jgi:thiosulfate/3-mercaptopyruvate sulfurtransferase